jgi:8-oxo-dGTP diphosphatase
MNGLGGKIEDGETPLQCVLREVEEETGIRLPSARFGGIITWPAETDWHGDEGPVAFFPGNRRGVWVYVADLPKTVEDPWAICEASRAEGDLLWMPDSVLFDPRNDKVVDNIRHYLPEMLKNLERHRTPDEFYIHRNAAGTIDAITQGQLSQDLRERGEAA